MKICSWYAAELDQLVIPGQLARGLRRADSFINLGVCGGYETLQRSSLSLHESHETGIVAGSAFGPLTTNFAILDQLVEHEPSSPTLFSHSVFNAAVGYMASSLKIYGTALTLTELEFPFFRGLEQASVVLSGGLSRYVLVLQIESYAKILQDVKPADGEWNAGVVCWLLAGDDEETDGIGLTLESLTANLTSRRRFLQFEETLELDGKQRRMQHPLQSAMELTAMLEEFDRSRQSRVRIDNSYGETVLCFGASAES